MAISSPIGLPPYFHLDDPAVDFTAILRWLQHPLMPHVANFSLTLVRMNFKPQTMSPPWTATAAKTPIR